MYKQEWEWVARPARRSSPFSATVIVETFPKSFTQKPTRLSSPAIYWTLWASEGFFPGGVNSGFFQGVVNRIFPKGPTLVNFHFTKSETRRKKHFSTKTLIEKYQFQNPGVTSQPASDARAWRICRCLAHVAIQASIQTRVIALM